jgi:hypothetical protein
VLPPVTATRWKSVDTAPAELGARAERWVVDELDFLELSIVATLAEAPGKQEALTAFVRGRGLAVDAEQQTKTRRVLEHLVGRALAAGARGARPRARSG